MPTYQMKGERTCSTATWPLETILPGYESRYGYCLPPYGTAYRTALRTSRIRRNTRPRTPSSLGDGPAPQRPGPWRPSSRTPSSGQTPPAGVSWSTTTLTIKHHLRFGGRTPAAHPGDRMGGPPSLRSRRCGVGRAGFVTAPCLQNSGNRLHFSASVFESCRHVNPRSQCRNNYFAEM